MSLTIAQRLPIGTGIIIIVLIFEANLFALRAAREVDDALDQVVVGGEERRGAAYEMRIALPPLVVAARESLSSQERNAAEAVQRAQRNLQNDVDDISGAFAYRHQSRWLFKSETLMHIERTGYKLAEEKLADVRDHLHITRPKSNR